MGQFRFLTAGEVHGRGRTAVIEGVPSGLSLSTEHLVAQVERLRPYGSPPRKAEDRDELEIVSGVRHGLTLGSPIGIWMPNRVLSSWVQRMAVEPVETEITRVTRLRPGQADLPATLKYQFDDVLNATERASAGSRARGLPSAPWHDAGLSTLAYRSIASRALSVG